jgi:hypothetical protein
MRLFWVLAAASLGCSRASASTPAPRERTEGDSGFAVVELFTSEGCSSCPPADDVLRDMAVESATSGRRIYPIAYHVDYWNELGWIDPYSSAEATRHQHDYARAQHQRGVYTPEMVVNGRAAFVGSDRSRAQQEIERALRGSDASAIELAVKTVEGRVVIDVTVPAVVQGAVVRLALVQRAAETHVRAGENAGRTLRHANLVRAFQTVELDAARKGHATFPAPPAASGAAVVAFLQDSATMAIRGAARAEL